MITNETIFLTGGAGFIGTALTRRYLGQGNRVIVYDSLVRNAMDYFPELRQHPGLTVIRGDVRDLEHLKRVIGEASYVFHLAAIAGVSKYFSIPAEVMSVNVIGTYNVLEAVKGNKKVRAFVDFSTSESYGSNCFNAKEEGDVKMENLSERRWTYATSKIASEKFGMSYYWQYGVPFIGVRPFNIYGPGQVGEGVISYFMNNVIRNETIQITGDGSQCRTYCYIDDFITGMELLLENTDKTVGQSFNIGTTTEIISVLSLAKLVREVAGGETPITFKKHQGEDVMVRSPNTDRIKSLGFEPKVELREGLARTYEWYRAHHVKLD